MIHSMDIAIIRKPYRRKLSLTVQISGKLKVTAPKSVPLDQIEKFIDTHRDWIDVQLKAFQSLRETHPQKRFVKGERFPLLGKTYSLDFTPAHKFSINLTDQRILVSIPYVEWQGFDPSVPHPELKKAIVAYFEKVGREILARRCEIYSERMQMYPSALSFRSQKTRWGSCSSKGRISLNWRLIVAPIEVIDYVIVHELAHLKFYDHSKSFWQLVGSQIPDYSVRRSWLKSHQYEADFLAKSSELHS